MIGIPGISQTNHIILYAEFKRKQQKVEKKNNVQSKTKKYMWKKRSTT